jgi:hypothetical protein
MARLTPQEYDALELAVRRGSRIAVTRRGTEYVVVAMKLDTTGGTERIETVHPSTGDHLVFALEELDSIQVIA